jgi:hypothetical protein
VAIVRDRLNLERRAAALSFPTVHVFGLRHLQAASNAGISPVILWGAKPHCMEARRARAKANRHKFDPERYERKNGRTFETYGAPDDALYRVVAFRPDGTRRPLEESVEEIIARMAG